jgi:hypothetical protein
VQLRWLRPESSVDAFKDRRFAGVIITDYQSGPRVKAYLSGLLLQIGHQEHFGYQ